MMWSDWTAISVHDRCEPSLLEKFPAKNASTILASVTSSLKNLSRKIETQTELDWIFEVLKYGLLNGNEASLIEVVDLYCDWLSVLLPYPSQNIPDIIVRDANHMVREMFRHIYRLFTNINPLAPDASHLEAACNTVLTTLENIGQLSSVMEADTWDSLLLLLLGLTDLLLSPPGPGGHLCHTAASVLCHTWLAACHRHFPAPALWKTFQSLALGWRHRIEMISHWSTINLALLSKQLHFLYGPDHPKLQVDSCCSSLNLSMSNQIIAQSSYRFLHILGNVIEISQRETICFSEGLFKAGLKSKEVISCLELLPDIFYKAMSVVSRMVDGYLGITRTSSHHTLAAKRPRVNTLLHLLGPWLFQAALVSTQLSGAPQATQTQPGFSLGRSEAISSLCLIFNSKRHNEVIEDAYLARFFIVLQKGLEDDLVVRSSVLRYFKDLLSRDLPGSNIIVPTVVKCLQGFAEASLTEEKIQMDVQTFRKGIICILKTLLPIPHHFSDLIPSSFKQEPTQRKFNSLKDSLWSTLFQNLQTEQDPSNCRYLLGLLGTFLEHELELGTEQEMNTAVVTWTTSLLDLVCYRLVSSWAQPDLSTSLAACELVSLVAARGARMGLGALVVRRALGSLAHFVTLQCGRPPPCHSRDLHSSIIACFHTCQDLLVHFPSLLNDRETMTLVLEITELAMSGSKSSQANSEEPTVKEDKKQSSVSLRVSNAAQELLSSVLLQVGNISGHKKIIESTVDEEQVIKCVKEAPCDPWFQPSQAFKYFFCDNNTLLAVSKECDMLEECGSGNLETTVIMRGASGKTAWKFQCSSAHLTCSKTFPKPVVISKEEKNNNDVNCANKQRVNISSDLPKVHVPACNIDNAIPSIDELVYKEDNSELEKLVFNRSETDSKSSSRRIDPAQPPPPVTHYKTARMVMAQLGFTHQMLNTSMCEELDSGAEEFWADLRGLDRMSTRTADSVYVYYVRSGQTEASEILANTLASDLPVEYSSLLTSMGHRLKAGDQGWRGQGSQASREVYYWENQSSELAILNPFDRIIDKETSENKLSSRRPTIGTINGQEMSSLFSSMRLKKENIVQNQKVAVVWFENIDDSDKFPLNNLIQTTSSVSLMILIQPLMNNLLKIRTVDTSGQVSLVSPLVDGVLVSPPVAGSLIRDTCLHVFRRERLEADTCEYHRRVALQNLKTKYGRGALGLTDTLSNLYH